CSTTSPTSRRSGSCRPCPWPSSCCKAAPTTSTAPSSGTTSPRSAAPPPTRRRPSRTCSGPSARPASPPSSATRSTGASSETPPAAANGAWPSSKIHAPAGDRPARSSTLLPPLGAEAADQRPGDPAGNASADNAGVFDVEQLEDHNGHDRRDYRPADDDQVSVHATSSDFDLGALLTVGRRHNHPPPLSRALRAPAAAC